jgi:hypothetical protein
VTGLYVFCGGVSLFIAWLLWRAVVHGVRRSVDPRIGDEVTFKNDGVLMRGRFIAWQWQEVTGSPSVLRMKLSIGGLDTPEPTKSKPGAEILITPSTVVRVVRGLKPLEDSP